MNRTLTSLLLIKMAKTFDNIKKQLSEQHYFMNDSWLRDCLGYFLSEHPDANAADILLLIINQWLLCDLREINNEHSQLPKNIQQHKHIILPGTYILQIEKAYDISTAKYKQLEKIRNISNENIEVTENENRPAVEAKTNRMMNLYLCDGVQEVIAMEYKPISTLDKIVPGYKVKIKGPVHCRRGVILLEEKNISMIGGEIENLLIKNATENVLARALNLPENPDPYVYITKDSGAYDLSDDDNMDIDFEAVANIEKLNETMKTLSATAIDINLSNQIPIIPPKKQESIILDELPICFEQEAQNVNEIVDCSDDEWIGMVDENNLDVVIGPSNSQPEREFASDLEFRQFEIDDPTEHNANGVSTNSNLSKVQNSEASVNNMFTMANNKARVQTPIFPVLYKTDAKSSLKAPVQTSSTTRPTITSSSSPSSTKLSNKQQVTKFKGSNSKITDFIRKTDATDRQPKVSIRNYETIRDVKKIIPSKVVIYKTIRATTNTLQKLTKKETNWYLEGSVTDGIDCLDVIFSTEVLEKLIGFSFNEFSQKKKQQKSNPKIKDELRQILRNTETVLIEMDALLKLELTPNETKAKIVCITHLTEEEKLQY